MITDGEIIITDISSEVAAMLWRELFQAQREVVGEIRPAPLAPAERALFDALTTELTARVTDTADRRKKAGAT